MEFIKPFLLKIVILLNIAVCIVCTDVSNASVAVFTSYKTSPYREVIAGFTESLNARPKIFDLKGDVSNGHELINDIVRFRPNVIFAVGTKASVLLAKRVKDIPIVTALISRPEKYLKGRLNVVGISMNPDPKDQFVVLKKIYPAAKNIGIIYNPANSAHQVRTIEASLPQGMTIIKRLVSSGSEVPEALREVRKKSDLLWLVMDETLVKELAFRHIVKFSITQKYPIVGFSQSMVRKGTFFSSVPDYKKIGEQAAIITARILKNGLPNRLFFPPISSGFVINGRVARLLNIHLTKEVRDEAIKIY